MASMNYEIVVGVADRATSKLDSIAGKAKNVAAAAAGIVGAAASAGAAIAGFALAQTTAVDAMAKTAIAGGVSAEALQELRFAAERSGASSDQLDAGLRRLTKRVGEAAEGGGAAKATFDRLGIAVRDSGGNVRSTEDIFQDFIAAAEGMGTTAEVSAAASALFGATAGPQLANLVSQGTAGVKALREEAASYGLVSNEQAAQAEASADAMANLGAVFSGIANELSADLIPIVEVVAEALAVAIPAAVDIAGRVFSTLRDFLSENVIPIIVSIVEIFTKDIPAAIDVVRNAFDRLKIFLNNILATIADRLGGMLDKILALVPASTGLYKELDTARQKLKDFSSEARSASDRLNQETTPAMEAAGGATSAIVTGVQGIVDKIRQGGLAAFSELEGAANDSAAATKNAADGLTDVQTNVSGLSMQEAVDEFGGVEEAADALGLSTDDVIAGLHDTGEAAAGAAPEVAKITGELDNAKTSADSLVASADSLIFGLGPDQLQKVINDAAAAAEAFAGEFNALRRELNPTAAKTEDYIDDVNTLATAYTNGLISAGEYADLLGTLKENFIGVKEEAEKLPETQASIEDWAAAISQAFGDIEGSAGAAIQGIAGLIGTITELNAVQAQQGGTLTTLQQLQGGATIGGFVGQALGVQGPTGQLATSLGGAAGFALGGPIGAIGGALLGSLFEDPGETTPRIVLGGGTALSASASGARPDFFRRTALGVSVQAQEVTEATQGVGAVLDAIVSLDDAILGIAQASGLATRGSLAATVTGAGGDRSTILGRYEGDTSSGVILADRFNSLLGGFDARIQSLVGTVSDAEEGIRRLQAAVILVAEIDKGPLEQYEEALRQANRTVVEVLDEQGQSLIELAQNYSGSTAELERLAAGTQAFNQAVVATLQSIDAASTSVGQITSGTIENLKFRVLGEEALGGSPEAQLDFLLRRADQLTSEIGGLGSAAEVQNQIALINQLVAQAGGLVQGADLGQFLLDVTPLLQEAEGQAQARLEAIREEVEAVAIATADAIRDAVADPARQMGDASRAMASSASSMEDAAVRMQQAASRFGNKVDQFPATVTAVLVTNEVNSAG